MPGDGLGQANRLTGGLADVGVVQEPVDGRGGQRFGHQLVKTCGVQVRGDRHRAFLVGGVDQPVEAFGGVGKTMLAVGLARHAAEAGHRTYFTNAADLAARCHRAAIEGRWATTMRFYAGPACLIIDLCRHRDYAEATGGGLAVVGI